MRLRVFLRTEVARERIAKRNIGLREFAKELDVSRSYASDIIAQRRSVSPPKRAIIAQMLSWRGATWDGLFRTECYTTTGEAI
jgi:transcriptional regulator with XRE-family HTH domain